MKVTETREKVFILIITPAPRQRIQAGYIAEKLNISRAMTHRHINALLKEKKIQRRWRSPYSYYVKMRPCSCDLKCTCQEPHIWKEKMDCTYYLD